MSEETSIDELRQEINITTRASIGIIAVRCAPTETFRVVEAIYLAARANKAAFRMWSMLHGWAQYEEDTIAATLDAYENNEDILFNPIYPVQTIRNTISILDAFAALHNPVGTVGVDGDQGMRNLSDYPDDCFYTMIDAHHFLEEPSFQAALRRQAHRAYESEQRLFIILPENVDLPESISSYIHVIDYNYPKIDELIESARVMFEALDEDAQPGFDDDEIRYIAQNGLGMHKTAFEAAMALAVTDWHQDLDNREQDTVTFDHVCRWVRHYKTESLTKTEVLELQESIDSDQIGGLQNYKEWMDTRKGTYSPAAVERGITPSRGVLVAGPAGTGKSLVAKAAGSQLNLPVVRFDIGRVFGAYIGQSEGRMRSVLKMLDAMAPIVLMVDEIDKGFAGSTGGSNDNGTSMRVFGTFLTWMQERDQKNRPVFLVFTANRVQGLPPELMRKGRLDELWAVNSPNSEEREDILNIHSKKRGLKIKGDSMSEFVKHTEGLVGSEIEALMEQCLIRAFNKDSDTIQLRDFLEERKVLKPLSESFSTDFKAIEEWGKQFARPASPPEMSGRKATHSGLRPKTSGRKIRKPPANRLN